MTDLTKSIANDFLGNGKISSADDDLKSLTLLADEPKKLHRTLFKIIEKKQIKKMLPPALKKMKTSTIRQLCLEKLEHMSEASIVSMIIGDATPTSSRHNERDGLEHERPSTGTQSQKRDDVEAEIAKSTSRDGSTKSSSRRKSPSPIAGLRTNDSPDSSSWTSGSGKHRWSRSPSPDKTPPGTLRTESNIAQDQSAARASESTSTWLEDLDTDELELRARALRSLSNRLDRLQGRVPEQDLSP